MSRSIKPKENMCAFRMKEIGHNLDGPPKGKQKELRDVSELVGRK